MTSSCSFRSGKSWTLRYITTRSRIRCLPHYHHQLETALERELPQSSAYHSQCPKWIQKYTMIIGLYHHQETQVDKKLMHQTHPKLCGNNPQAYTMLFQCYSLAWNQTEVGLHISLSSRPFQSWNQSTFQQSSPPKWRLETNKTCLILMYPIMTISSYNVGEIFPSCKEGFTTLSRNTGIKHMT